MIPPMNIQITLGSLKLIGWHEFALRFFLGGMVTAMTGAIAIKFGPVVGGLFLAFPSLLPASLTLIEKHENQKHTEQGKGGKRRGRQAAAADAAGATLGSVGMVVFALVVWQCAPHYDPWLVSGMAMLAWAIVAISLWVIRKHRPWSRPAIHQSVQ
jgi:Protein of unknown function (DUF3147)